jgi:DNA-binding NtrC family response regulator
VLGVQQILVADDDPDARELFTRWLRAEGYQVRAVADGLACLREVRAQPPDLVVLDLKMPPGTWGGYETLGKLHEADPTLPVIIVSNKADLRRAVDSVRAGAYDFIDKAAASDELPVAVANALRLRHLEHRTRILEEQNRLFRQESKAEFAGHRMVHQSEPMRELWSLVTRVAPTDATVMILGETGTGKELVATAVHYLSPKREGPLIRVNCAALPESLLEDELFGHEKGAFTGAHARREGRFELAHGGTIFLDEIGDMSPATQAKVLRVLEGREFERVGGTRTIKVDVRIVAATNRSLRSMVDEGAFREDLYWRLGDVILHLPPLRERREDIPGLAEAIMGEFGASYPGRTLSREAMSALLRHDWPGNVRELKAALKNAAIFASGPEIGVSEIQAALRRGRG